jgi:hypothetical protein
MPFRSERQKRWMFKNKPSMAKKWVEKYGSKVVKKKSGKRSSKKTG